MSNKPREPNEQPQVLRPRIRSPYFCGCWVDSKGVKISRSTFGIVAILLAGCNRTRSVVFPTWTPPTANVLTANNDFNQFQQLATDTLQNCSAYTKYLNLSGRDQVACDRLLRPQYLALQTLVTQSCTFQFEPKSPFTNDPLIQGWGFLGNHIAWRISYELSEGNTDKAISDFIVGVKFCQILLGGDASDAILGDELMNRMRVAITPHLLSMGAGQLESLSGGIANALVSRPLRANVIANESSEMMRTVDAIQKMALAHHFNRLSLDIGQAGQPAIESLSLLPSVRSQAGLTFFQGLANDATRETQWLSDNANLPANKRAKAVDFFKRSQKKAGWKSISSSMFTVGNSWLQEDDSNLARMRLLVLYCRLLAESKTNHVAPAAIPSDVAIYDIDPFTGKPFFYVPNGTQFLIYSAGANGLDDGGQTDSSFTAPDLFLENTSN